MLKIRLLVLLPFLLVAIAGANSAPVADLTETPTADLSHSSRVSVLEKLLDLRTLFVATDRHAAALYQFETRGTIPGASPTLQESFDAFALNRAKLDTPLTQARDLGLDNWYEIDASTQERIRQLIDEAGGAKDQMLRAWHHIDGLLQQLGRAPLVELLQESGHPPFEIPAIPDLPRMPRGI
ncbi:hypothetical protein A4X06_0g9274 [Tilletia controversa]|uniref:Chorismate mutase n=1 Tax=Tilletia controversa TaxID=13291 RepID=A0A8X7SS20_9BASI|nr:hypothetical protein A4X06_0g9274 [Tilletia controversa]